MSKAVPEVDYRRIVHINAEAGPGEYNDPSFIQKLSIAIWGSEELKRRSVTGNRSNAFKERNQKKGLESEKLKFIYGNMRMIIYNFYLDSLE